MPTDNLAVLAQVHFDVHRGIARKVDDKISAARRSPCAKREQLEENKVCMATNSLTI